MWYRQPGMLVLLTLLTTSQRDTLTWQAPRQVMPTHPHSLRYQYPQHPNIATPRAGMQAEGWVCCFVRRHHHSCLPSFYELCQGWFQMILWWKHDQVPLQPSLCTTGFRQTHTYFQMFTEITITWAHNHEDWMFAHWKLPAHVSRSFWNIIFFKRFILPVTEDCFCFFVIVRFPWSCRMSTVDCIVL